MTLAFWIFGVGICFAATVIILIETVSARVDARYAAYLKEKNAPWARLDACGKGNNTPEATNEC